jgi:hypothetical protein
MERLLYCMVACGSIHTAESIIKHYKLKSKKYEKIQ